MIWFEDLVGWRENTDLNTALHRQFTSAGLGQAAQLRVISLSCLRENISGTLVLPVFMSNCFLENFFQPPNVPPELEECDPTEKAAARLGVGRLRHLQLLPVPESLGGFAAFTRVRLWRRSKRGH